MMAEDFVDSINKGYSNISVCELHFCSVLGSEAQGSVSRVWTLAFQFRGQGFGISRGRQSRLARRRELLMKMMMMMMMMMIKDLVVV